MRGQEKRTIKQRIQRAKRTHARVRGTVDRPRLSVFRSNNHIYAQIIDDTTGKTLVSASTVKVDKAKTGKKVVAAGVVGKALAAQAKEKGIQAVVFDRGRYRYHGRVKQLAEAAREGGLAF